MLPSDIKDLYKSYQSIYQQEDDDISSEMIEEIVEELVEECLEFGYTLDEATNAIQEAAEIYFDAEELEEAKVTYGSDTESPEERTARAKERLGGRKATARKAAVKGAVERVKTKAKGIKAGVEIAGSIAKDEARRAGRGALHAVGKAASAVASAPGKAVTAVTDAARAKKAEVKQGVKSLLGRGLRKAAGAAGVVAQKARKAGAAAGRAAERLGESSINEEPSLGNIKATMATQRSAQNAAGMRGPELTHGAKPASTGSPKAAGSATSGSAVTQPRSREFSHGTKPLKSVVKGGLTMSYEPEGENVDENVGGSVKMKPGSGLGGGTPVYPKGQEPKATGAKLPSLQNAHYEYSENDIYDLVMEYLLDTEQAETISEAQYIMSQMDVEMITNIVEETTTEKLARRASEKAEEPGAKTTYKPQGPGFKNPRSKASIMNQIAGRAKSRTEHGVDSQYGEGTPQHSEQPRRGGRAGRGSKTDRPGTANMPNPNRKPKN
jgi:hypothetical protein